MSPTPACCVFTPVWESNFGQQANTAPVAASADIVAILRHRRDVVAAIRGSTACSRCREQLIPLSVSTRGDALLGQGAALLLGGRSRPLQAWPTNLRAAPQRGDHSAPNPNAHNPNAVISGPNAKR